MIRPPPRCRISGTHIRMPRVTGSMFWSNPRRQSSGSLAGIVPFWLFRPCVQVGQIQPVETLSDGIRQCVHLHRIRPIRRHSQRRATRFGDCIGHGLDAGLCTRRTDDLRAKPAKAPRQGGSDPGPGAGDENGFCLSGPKKARRLSCRCPS